MNKNVAIILSIAAIFITATCVGATVINSDVDMKQNTFDGIKINVRNGKTFTVEAVNNSKENIYIQKVFLNGKPYSKSYITYDDIMNGSTLKFVMGKKPNKKFGEKPIDRPAALNKIEDVQD